MIVNTSLQAGEYTFPFPA